MSTKVFYTFYITKTPSQTGFGCRKSVENPVENRVENPRAPALRSQFGNAGLVVLTHQPSVCCLDGPCPARHLRSQFGNAGLVVLTHQPCVCCLDGPRSLCLRVASHLCGPACPPQRLSCASWVLPWKARRAWAWPGPQSCPDRPRGPHLGSVTSTLAGTMPRGRGRSGWLVAPAGAAPPAGVAT